MGTWCPVSIKAAVYEQPKKNRLTGEWLLNQVHVIFLSSDDSRSGDTAFYFILAAYLEAPLFPLVQESSFRACKSFRGQLGQTGLMGRKHRGGLGLSGHMLLLCLLWRSECGLLFPKKSCDTLFAPVTCLAPAHALVSCPCHSVTFLFFPPLFLKKKKENSFSLPHLFFVRPL